MATPTSPITSTQECTRADPANQVGVQSNPSPSRSYRRSGAPGRSPLDRRHVWVVSVSRAVRRSSVGSANASISPFPFTHDMVALPPVAYNEGYLPGRNAPTEKPFNRKNQAYRGGATYSEGRPERCTPEVVALPPLAYKEAASGASAETEKRNTETTQKNSTYPEARHEGASAIDDATDPWKFCDLRALRHSCILFGGGGGGVFIRFGRMVFG